MFLGLAGPGKGAKGRTEGGRSDGRAEGAFWSASTDLYCWNEKCVQKTYTNLRCSDFSNHTEAQVPIFTIIQNTIFQQGAGSRQSRENGARTAARNPQRAGGQDDVSLNKLPQINCSRSIFHLFQIHENGWEWRFGFGSCSVFQTPFLLEFEEPGGDFQNPICCGNLTNGTRIIFLNLKFPEFHVPSIQNELIWNWTASNHDLPASAERRLIFLWDGCWDSAEIDTPELFIHFGGVLDTISIRMHKQSAKQET